MTTKQGELVETKPHEETGVASLIARLATDPACDPAKLRELLAVRREWEAENARQAFNAAVCEFQRICPVIQPLDSNDGKAYAKMDRIWSAIRPSLVKTGLSPTWGSAVIEGDGVVHMRGHMRHIQGHAEPIEYMVPIPEPVRRSKDNSPVQNKAQLVGSATTYGGRYGTCLFLGLSIGKDYNGAASRGITDPLTLPDWKELTVLGKTKKLTREQINEIACETAGVQSAEEITRASLPKIRDAIERYMEFGE